VVLGDTGRNFAAGMSGGVAYVYDPQRRFTSLCNGAMVSFSFINDDAAGEADDAPRARSVSVADQGLGDPLHHDAARLRILIERHHRHTGSARAATILADWDRSLRDFVKVTPNDYRRALMDLAAERATARAVAAE